LSDKTKYIEAKPIDELDDKQALLRVMGDYEQAKSDKSEALDRAERYLAIYKAQDDPNDAIDQTTGLVEDDEAMYANVHLPLGASMVRSGVAKLYNQIFSTPRYFGMEADEIKDAFFAEEITAHLLKRHIEMGFKKTTYKALLEANIFDYAVTGTRWLLQDGYVPRPRRTTETVNLGKIGVQRQRVSSFDRYIPDKVDRSDVFNIPFRDCFHDAESKNDLEDSRFFIDRRDEMMEHLMMESALTKSWGKYKNIDKVIRRKLLADRAGQDEASNLGAAEAGEYVKTRRVEVIRYWTRNHLIEVAEEQIIFRGNMPGWALQIWCLFPDSDAFGGMGLLQTMERNLIDINASMNARRNYQNLVANPFGVIDQELLGAENGPPRMYPGKFAVSKGGDVSKKMYVYQPGPSATLDSIQDVQMNAEMVQRLSHTADTDQAQVSSGRTTATETRFAQSGGSSLTSLIAQRFEEEALCKIYLNQFYLEQCFLSRAETFKYNGEHGDQWYMVDPASYMWDSVPRFIPRGTTFFMQDAVQTQQFLAAIQTVKTLLPGAKTNDVNLGIEVFRRLAPKNYSDFIEDPNVPTHNVPPEIENQLFAQGQRPEVSPANDPREHIASHEALKRTPDYVVWPTAFKMALDDHIAKHGQVGATAVNPMMGMMGMGAADPANAMRGIRPPGLGMTP
jgi:hypothetical protein